MNHVREACGKTFYKNTEAASRRLRDLGVKSQESKATLKQGSAKDSQPCVHWQRSYYYSVFFIFYPLKNLLNCSSSLDSSIFKIVLILLPISGKILIQYRIIYLKNYV